MGKTITSGIDIADDNIMQNVEVTVRLVDAPTGTDEDMVSIDLTIPKTAGTLVIPKSMLNAERDLNAKELAGMMAERILLDIGLDLCGPLAKGLIKSFSQQGWALRPGQGKVPQFHASLLPE